MEVWKIFVFIFLLCLLFSVSFDKNWGKRGEVISQVSKHYFLVMFCAVVRVWSFE